MAPVTLNYVWINAVPHHNGAVSDLSSAQCPIPKRYLKSVRAVRKKNPDIDITIWMDAYKICDVKGDLSKAFAKAAKIKGVVFRGLREIPTYRNNPLFAIGENLSKDSSGVVWKQVDLARLLVLRHSLQKVGGV